MLHSLKPASGSTHRRKRIARGNSGKGGTTAGRGTKGQQSRTGKGRKFGFEGGQVSLLARQPKLGGFKNPRRVEFEVINLSKLEKNLPAGSYTADDLRAKRLIRRKGQIKLLGSGTLSKKFDIQVHAASDAARTAIEKAGGKVTILPE